MAKIPPFLRVKTSDLVVPPPYGDDLDFFQALRGYIKFSLVVLFIVVLLGVLLWNMQPWFEIEIKPTNKAQVNQMPDSTKAIR